MALELNLEQETAAIFDLSVVIPIYRDTIKFANLLASYHEAFASKAIRYEIVIVDNNSPNSDAIHAIVESYKNMVPITFVMQPKLIHPFSLCSARNRGVLNARGRFIFFTDSDCLIDECFVKSFESILAGEAEDHSVKIFTGERVFVRVPDEAMDRSSILQKIQGLERVPSASNYGKLKDRRFPWIERLPDQEHPWNFVHGCFVLMKKLDYMAVGGSDTRYDGNWGYEEIDLIYRMVTQVGARVHYLPDAKVFHQEFAADLARIGENSSRSNKSSNPNYQRICELIPGFDDFKKKQWETLHVEVD